MKLAVVSHPCVTPVNQAIYGEIQRQTGWDTRIIAPARWRDDYGDRVLARDPRYTGDLVGLDVVGKGNIPLHVYRAGLRGALRGFAPDVVFVHHEPYALATAQAFHACRGLSCAVGFYSAQNLKKRYPPPFSSLERYVFSHARFALPCSAAVGGVLEGKGFKGPRAVVPLAVDVDVFRPRSDRRETGPLQVGSIGRLVAEKGLDVVLRALVRLRSEEIAVRVIGDGSDREKLKGLAAQLGVADLVTWHGYVPHSSIHEILAEMDVLAVPSLSTSGWTEQFGRVVIESLACGVPVVASRSGELPNLVTDLEGGWLFPEGDDAALAAILQELASDRSELQAAGSRGRAAVNDQYSLAAVARTMAETMQQAREKAA